jgi:uncharacterized protein YgbK (DUF1537 family)
MELTAIADDLTGACDVGAELAAAGQRVRVVVAPGDAVALSAGEIAIVNTQSRAVAPAAATARVRAALRGRPVEVVLKKIDTALRGHLGAEIDALDAPVFVLPAIPAAGRVTRGGCQWFNGTPLAATEFARDPEGPGAESSVAAVIARESARRVAVLGRDVVAEGRLTAEVDRGRRAGVDVFVVDAETDADVAYAVRAILDLPRPVCLAGSIALAAAVARDIGGSRPAVADVARVPLPALIVNGSLHSRARAQTRALVAAGLAVTVPSTADAGDQACAALAAGSNVVLAAPPSDTVPDAAAMRATEHRLAETVRAIALTVPVPTLVSIGGETSFAILTALAAATLAITGRIAPLVACGTIAAGVAAGTVLVSKGGSGGEPDVIARLLAASAEAPGRTAEGRS